MAVNLDRDCKRTLSRAERDFYEENGYVIVPDVLPLEELNRLNQELHQLWTARAADPSRSAEDVNNIHGLGEISPQSEALATDERIIGLIEALVSPGIALFSAKMISKAPHQADMVCHWHQDDAYWHDIYPSDCRLSVWQPVEKHLVGAVNRLYCQAFHGKTRQNRVYQRAARSRSRTPRAKTAASASSPAATKKECSRTNRARPAVTAPAACRSSPARPSSPTPSTAPSTPAQSCSSTPGRSIRRSAITPETTAARLF